MDKTGPQIAVSFLRKLRPFTEEWREVMVENYPFLQVKDEWTNELIESKSWIYLDDLPVGWVKAFGEQMCEELMNILRAHDYVEKYQIVQVKEKFGALCWYDNAHYDWEDYKKWYHKYEELSRYTCVDCGNLAEVIATGGWISPFCINCLDEMDRNIAHDLVCLIWIFILQEYLSMNIIRQRI